MKLFSILFYYSGVATLSGTDSSTTSSDTSDPGSPYSPPSLVDSDTTPTASSSPHQAATPKKQPPLKPPPKMPPLTQTLTNNRCQQNQPHQWPWNNNNVAAGEDKSSKINATNINNNNNKLKRPSTDKAVGEVSATKRSRSTSTEKIYTGKGVSPKPPALIAKSANKFIEDTSNAKITGYFKTQTKTTPLKTKDTASVVMQAPVPPLSEISKPPQNENLKKYFNMLAQQQQVQAVNGLKTNEISNISVNNGMTPILKKPIEKKTAKVSPMVSNVNRKGGPQKMANIAPKKPVTIAPRISKVAPTQINTKKLPTAPSNGKFLEQMKQLPTTPTVLLTAIRIPPTTQQQQMPPLQPTQPTMASSKAQAKVGPLFSMMPNLVQIPNLVPTAKTQNLVVNSGLTTARLTNAAAQILVNGAMIKLQQQVQAAAAAAQNGNAGQTIDQAVPFTTPNSNTNTAMTQVKPITAMQQQKHVTYTTQQATQLTPQLFMTTSPGLYYNTPLPAVYTLSQGMQNIPALHPIQPQSANVLPSINTILPSHHQTNQQQQKASLSTNGFSNQQQMNSISAPVTATSHQHSQGSQTTNIPKTNHNKVVKVPKPTLIPTAAIPTLVTPTSSSVGSQTTASLFSKSTGTLKPAHLSLEPPKLVPMTLKINTALPTVPVTPPKMFGDKTATPTTTIDLCSPTIPLLSPKERIPLSPASPRSLVLERIKLKKPIDTTIDTTVTEESEISIDISITNTDTSMADKPFETSLTPNLPERSKSPMLSQPKTIRFPVDRHAMRMGVKGSRRSDAARLDGVCYWEGCNKKFDSNSCLLDHLQTHHVNPQTGPFACLWSGCKVHGRKSCSRTWLERHVLPHGGKKTYKCIVDGCGLRFGSQVRLYLMLLQVICSENEGWF